MKKVIGNKMYNTNTAELLASYSENCGSFEYISEGLYRTKKGAYFVAGEGGALSRYSIKDGQNAWCGSEDIRILSEEEAREWMEEHGTADEYISAFGEVEEA